VHAVSAEFEFRGRSAGKVCVMIAESSGAAALCRAVQSVSDTLDEAAVARQREAALMTVTAEDFELVIHAQFDDAGPALCTGLGASPGAAVGRVYFTADDAADAADRGENVILVRDETTPSDVHGMMEAVGLLTTRGGLVSHAAVVARGWGTPAVVGADAISIGERRFSVGEITVLEGEVISIDGTTGMVMLGEMATQSQGPPPEFFTLLEWADAVRAGHLAVRANADTAADATTAREFGAEGIGLCRTEHMFLAADRLPVVRRMILARDANEEGAALEELGRVQQVDFESILDAMDGLPVTVRLLDPPLHEFLPSVSELLVKQAREGLSEFEQLELDAAESWAEHNPMIGTRGVRLGVMKPGLYAMQVRALLAAAATQREAGKRPIIEIMIPLTVTRDELALARSWVEAEISLAHIDHGDITIGTMIETPRAAVRGDEIAEAADFFSFGTNDLTQLTFGFSRDDVERRLMPTYLEHGLLAANPFETIDQEGVGELVRIGAEHGRATKPGMKLGVCGEHGGDPESIDFFHRVGLDYVSCSPYRVPIARLAAAQAVLRQRRATAGEREQTTSATAAIGGSLTP
jgi:pyruvate, orthophosphate dikinase